jgi:adenine-specific DNA-methyltransferase
VYPDNYKDSIKNYLDLTGQTSSGTKVSSNLESSGRYHTDWLNMMYPRLIVARAMLHSEGLIFISIDESEYHNLRTICDDVLGEENYLNTVSIKVRENAGESGGGEDKKLKKNIEYIVIYSKDRNSYTLPKLSSETSLRLLLAQNELAGDNYVYSSVITKLGEKKFLKTIEDGAGLPIDVYTYDSFESESVKSLSRKTDKPLIDIYLQYYDKIYTTYNARTSIRDRVKEAVGDFSGLVEISYKPRSGKYKDVLTSKFFSGNTMRLWANLNEISEIKGNDIVIKSPLGTMWNDISFAALANEGDVKFDNGKKPVSMIKGYYNSARMITR